MRIFSKHNKCLRSISCLLIVILSSFVYPSNIKAQKATLSGKVWDKNTLSPLFYASVSVNNGKLGVTTNQEGKFEILLNINTTYKISFGHLGYQTKELSFSLNKDSVISIQLIPTSTKLDEIVIQSEDSFGSEVINNTATGTINLTTQEIVAIPNIGGEPDIIKVMQLLPGTIRGVEGGTDFFVRGGDADQNLVYLDGATIYNTGHLLGFLSVFNTDAIGHVQMIKGAFPAYYGGRLSSVLDIKTTREIPEKSQFKASVGIISSKFNYQKPLINDKLSLKFSFRRTYIDKLLALSDNDDMQLPYYFYDYNGVIDYKPNAKNTFYFSWYRSVDILDFSELRDNSNDDINVYSTSQSFGWRNVYNENRLIDFNLSRSTYSYIIDNSVNYETRTDRIFVTSKIVDHSLKFKVQDLISDKSTLHWGADVTSHNISPSVLESSGIIEGLFPSNRSKGLFAVEGALYSSFESSLGSNIKFNIGLRQSYSITEGMLYTKTEPRLAALYRLNRYSSFKASYSKNSQYMHRVSSSNVSLPVDIWYTVTRDIKPQWSNQWVVGYTRTFPEKRMILETEFYYKDLYNLTEYEEGTNLVFNTGFERLLLQGNGNAYGWEVLLKKENSKLSGWLSYTLSKSERRFTGLNHGNAFPSRYDRRHNLSLVGFYQFNERVKFSFVWEYISGSRFTAIIGQYATLNPANAGLDVFNIYSGRNAVTLSDAHRLDIGINIKNKPHKKLQSEWQISIYNVYNRVTPVALLIERNPEGKFIYRERGLFGLLPSVSYSLTF